MSDPKRARKRHQFAKIFWLANMPPATAAYFLVPHQLFVRVGLLYTMLVSIYANFASEGAREDVAEDRTENPMTTKSVEK